MVSSINWGWIASDDLQYDNEFYTSGWFLRFIPDQFYSLIGMLTLAEQILLPILSLLWLIYESFTALLRVAICLSGSNYKIMDLPLLSVSMTNPKREDKSP